MGNTREVRAALQNFLNAREKLPVILGVFVEVPYFLELSTTHIVPEIKTGEHLAISLFSKLLLSALKIKNSSPQAISKIFIDIFSLAR